MKDTDRYRENEIQTETLGKRRDPVGKRRGPHESEKEGSGTHVAETAPPLIFFFFLLQCSVIRL